MNVPLPPILDEQYRIPLNAGTVSIDALVANILSHATQFPVRQTGNAQQVGEALYAELPRAGVSLQAAVDELMGSAGTFYRKNAHPGMFSFVAPPGLPTDALGHALTAALNQNVTGYMGAPGATAVERTMIRWMCQLDEFERVAIVPRRTSFDLDKDQHLSLICYEIDLAETRFPSSRQNVIAQPEEVAAGDTLPQPALEDVSRFHEGVVSGASKLCQIFLGAGDEGLEDRRDRLAP